jgi:hypothetical protein
MMEDSWPLSILKRYLAHGLERGLACNLIFSVRVKTHTSCHKTKPERVVETIVTRWPLDTISGHCQKSPPKTTTLSPKGKSGRYMMSRKVRSIISA